MSCHVFAGRFRSRQRRTVGKKSENGLYEGYTNSQRIDKCSQIHIHVRQDVKREQVSVA